jgi:hypothetical protein
MSNSGAKRLRHYIAKSMLDTPHAQILKYRKFNRDGHLNFFLSRNSRLNVFQDKTESDYPNEQKCHYLIQRQSNHNASTVVAEVIRIWR